MSKLTDFTDDTEIQKATNSRLGLVKGGKDIYVDSDGQMEVMNGYGGSFKVSVDGVTATIGEGRIHNGLAPQHIIISKEQSTMSITTGTLNAIWIVLDQNGNSSYYKTNQITAGPVVSGEGTFYCILLAVIGYENNVAIVQQCHFGDIIINGIWY